MKKQYWLCKEGTEEFLCEGTREEVERDCEMWNAVIIKETKCVFEVDSEGNETHHINK